MAGDTVIIHADHDILLSNNLNFSGAPMHIMVYGTWQFSGGGSKISLPCGSYIETFEGGTLVPDPDYQGFSETVRICNITYWNTTDGPQEGYFIWPGPPDPLPVELISFTGAQDEEHIILEWMTASEAGVEGFELYRSLDGTDQAFIGFQESAGQSFAPRHYELTDVPATSGMYYYHLREIGLDGSHEEIATTMTYFKSTNRSLRCYPNPLAKEDILHVEIPDHSGSIDVRLIGLDGKWLHPLSFEDHGRMMVGLDRLPVQSGMQMIQVISGGQVIGSCRFLLE